VIRTHFLLVGRGGSVSACVWVDRVGGWVGGLGVWVGGGGGVCV